MFIILIVIMAVTALINPKFLSGGNLGQILVRTSLFAIIGMGVAYVIITGGIDLSIGSLIALIGVILCMLLKVDLEAPDSYSDASISPIEKSIKVSESETKLKPGDDVIFRNGLRYKKKGFKVAAVMEGGSKIMLEEQESWAEPGKQLKDDSEGELIKLHSVSRFGAKSDAKSSDDERWRKLLFVPGDYSWLKYDDVLTFYAGENYEESSRVLVTGTKFNGTLTEIEMRAPIKEGYSAEFFVPYKNTHMPVYMAIGISLLVAVGVGLIHGLFVTKIGLQPFVVTLCGFLIYRGAARTVTDDQNQTLDIFYENAKAIGSGTPVNLPVPGLEHLQYALMKHLPWQAMSDEEIIKQAEHLAKDNTRETGEIGLDLIAWIPIQTPVLIMLGIAILAIVLLRLTVFGRHLMALGNNEKAARFSGINTSRLTISAYVISATLAGVMGIIFIFKFNVMQPSSGGTMYELYAIAAAVLGGCSLRGGSGTIVGVIIGAAIMQVLYNTISLADLGNKLEPAIIGGVLLISVTFDELVRKIAAKRRSAASTSSA